MKCSDGEWERSAWEFWVSHARKPESASVSLSAKQGNSSACLVRWEFSENPCQAFGMVPGTQEVCRQNSSGMLRLVLQSICQKGHWHPRVATGWRIVLEVWWLRGDANDAANYLESLKYRRENYIRYIVSHKLFLSIFTLEKCLTGICYWCDP